MSGYTAVEWIKNEITTIEAKIPECQKTIESAREKLDGEENFLAEMLDRKAALLKEKEKLEK